MKLEFKHISAYLPHKVECSYINTDSNRRITATVTGLSILDGVETTYKRKKNGCAGDYIGFEGRNNIYDLEFKLHLKPLIGYSNIADVFDEFSEFDNDNFRMCFLSELVPLNKFDFLNVTQFNKFLKYHFDIFGLNE